MSTNSSVKSRAQLPQRGTNGRQVFTINTLFSKIAVTLAIAITSFACQNENSVGPDPALTESARAVNDVISPNLSKVYKLTNHGDATLTYYADGRLKQVMHGPNVRGSVNVRTDYTYSAGSIHALSYVGNSPYYDETYLINVNTGRCYEYKGLKYLYSNSSQTDKTELVYQYNAKGQLQTASDKANAAIRTEYTYNVDGDMSRAIHYGINYSTLVVGVQSDYTFLYDQPAGDPILADRYPLNVEVAGFTDPYLSIFGKPGKHLVKLITEKSSLGGTYYTYKLNPDGYVTERKEYKLFNGALVETKAYDYLVTNIGLSF